MGIDGVARAADTPATASSQGEIAADSAARAGDRVAKSAFKVVSTLAVPSDRAPAPVAGALNP